MNKKSQPLCYACSKPAKLKECTKCNSFFCYIDCDQCNNCKLFFCNECSNNIICDCGEIICDSCFQVFECSNWYCPHTFCNLCFEGLVKCDGCSSYYCHDCIYTSKFPLKTGNYCKSCSKFVRNM